MSSTAISTLVPPRSAIYLWKMRLKPPSYLLQDPGLFLQWLERAASTTFGELRDRPLCHYLHLGSIQLRGAGLPPDKRQTFSQFLAKSSKNRHWMTQFLSELGQHNPALYVGETGNLRTRTMQHLHYQTDFGAFVEGSEFDWTDLELHFFDLGEPSSEEKAIRTALEYLSATLTIAGRTSRPG